jgi:hypothetical protein
MAANGHERKQIVKVVRYVQAKQSEERSVKKIVPCNCVHTHLVFALDDVDLDIACVYV